METDFSKQVINIILACLLFKELYASCLNTSCDCYADEYSGLVEYQCPNRLKTRMVIRIEEAKEMKVICMDELAVDNILPKRIFSYEHIIIETCDITRKFAHILNISNIKTFKMDDSFLREDFVQYLFDIPLPSLERLTFKATQLKNVLLENLNAPKLFFIDFENMNHNVAFKTMENLTRLEILNAMNNEITTIKRNYFENLSSLRELHMMFNVIENIDEEAFKDLKKLRILNLANNDIKYMKRRVLEPLDSLYHVTLEGNYGVSLDDYLFANFSELAVVHLGASDLTTIPENIFSGSSGILEISFDYNDISVIPERLFEGLVNLKSLDLKYNNIKSLNGVFRGLVNLRELELNNNKISSIELEDFESLSSLVYLNLEYNNIGRIHDLAFKSNINLEKLDLSNNNYQYEVVDGKVFTNSPFSKCENLKSLDLSFNLMKDVPDDIFLNARHLKELNLEENKMETLDLEDVLRWSIAYRGVSINLKNNNISHFFFDHLALEKIDPDYDSLLEEMVFEGIMNTDNEESKKREKRSVLLISQTLKCDCYAESLSTFTKMADIGIILDLNQLTCDGPPNMEGIRFLDVPASDLLCEFSSVTEESQCTNSDDCSCLWRPYDRTVLVNCSHNNLTRLPALFEPIDLNYQKMEVYLEGNILKNFSIVEGYENVTGLFMASNFIDNVSWIPPNIEVIDLSFNNLTHLSYHVLDMLSVPLVKNITLKNNPWSCECFNHYMTNFLRENIQKIDAQDIKCANSGLTMHNLNREDLCHEIRLYIIIVVLIFSPIIMILIVVVFFYKYRQEIKVWLYARNLCMKFLEEEHLDEGKEYDVFVSYSQKDAEFVENTLVPIMENTPYHYKLCLHYRDWVPGSFISENIAKSVSKSRRTLIVLTPNFLESIWGKMEFRTAHAEAMKERRQRVILLLKEEVDMEKLDDELRSYVSTNTYLKWEDPWFWKKLRYALPRADVIDNDV